MITCLTPERLNACLTFLQPNISYYLVVITLTPEYFVKLINFSKYSNISPP